MPSSLSLTFRGIVVEDLMRSATFAQTTATILGLGAGITVTPFVAAATDSAAGSAGVPIGAVYINTGGSFNYLATRLS